MMAEPLPQLTLTTLVAFLPCVFAAGILFQDGFAQAFGFSFTAVWPFRQFLELQDLEQFDSKNTPSLDGGSKWKNRLMTVVAMINTMVYFVDGIYGVVVSHTSPAQFLLGIIWVCVTLELLLLD